MIIELYVRHKFCKAVQPIIVQIAVVQKQSNVFLAIEKNAAPKEVNLTRAVRVKNLQHKNENAVIGV